MPERFHVPSFLLAIAILMVVWCVRDFLRAEGKLAAGGRSTWLMIALIFAVASILAQFILAFLG